MSNQSSLKIIIVGAGIAGLSAARALRGEGHEIILLERSQQLREIGAAILTGPNATRIAQQWGLDPQRVGSVSLRGYRIIPVEGAPAVFETDFVKEFDAALYGHHRVDLHNELRRLATADHPDLPGQPALLRTGIKIVDINVESGEVTLDDGEILQGGVVIGADGIRSMVRGHVLDVNKDGNLTGESIFRALIPVESLEKGDPEIVAELKKAYCSVWMHEKCRFVTYWCRDMTVLNVGAIVPNDVFGGETHDYEGVGDINRLKEFCQGASPTLEFILSSITTLGAFQIRTLDALPTWVKGRVILIGDAAHAMVPYQGQGGSQAFEDAEALGVYFGSVTSSLPSTSDITSILHKVEAVRRERATFVQGKSLELGKVHRSPTAASTEALKYNAYNYGYRGAEDWARRHGMELPA